MKDLFQIAIAGALLAACTSSDETKQAAHVGDVAFDAPSNWVQKDAKGAKGGAVTTSLWVPDENPNKESVEIVRTSDARNDLATVTRLSRLLSEAQHALPHGHASASATFTTLSGRVGARVDAEFVPAGLHTSYHRIHAAILEPDGVVIHVLYTAARPDADLKALNMILQSIHRGEA